MDEIFQQLESHVNSFIRNYMFLKTNNLKLHEDKLLLTHEHKELIKKHEMAIVKIEAMLARLKSIEGLL